jgi:hypothetical protein
MEMVLDLDDTAATLAALSELRLARMAADRDILLTAVHYADVRNGETARTTAGPDGRALPGMERPVRLGGTGTPLVAEFAAADVAGELEISPFTARSLIADGLDLRHRHPRLWARVQACEVPVWAARKIAAATRGLDAAGAALVDARVAPYADGRLAWSRLFEVLEAAVIEADPDAAAERERRAAEESFAKVGRSNDHGQKTLYVKDNAAAIARLDATIAYLADALKALGDTHPEEIRRVKAVVIMANPLQAVQLLATFQARARRIDNGPGYGEDQPFPDDTTDDINDGAAAGTAGSDRAPHDDEATSREQRCHGEGVNAFLRPEPFRPSDIPCCPHAQATAGMAGGYRIDWAKLLPTVTLYLHLAVTPPTTGAQDGGELQSWVGDVVRWEGEGPVTVAYMRELLGPWCRFTIKPLIDLPGQVPVTAYETPASMREAVHLITGGDVYPYASSTSRRLDLDHVEPYRPPDDGGPPGQTRPGNLAPLTRFHHRLKTHGGWQVREPFPGIYLWRAPHGSIFLVDHTGTRKINAPWDGTAGRTRAPQSIRRSPVDHHFAKLLLTV